MNAPSRLLTVREIDFAVRRAGPFEDALLWGGGDRWPARLVRFLEPLLVVELGTGDGVTAAQVLAALPKGGALHTVNWPNPPSGDDVGRRLREYAQGMGTMRVFQEAGWTREQFLLQYSAAPVKMATQHYADTCEPRVLASVPDGIELLWIDSTHTRECAASEWAAWSPKLADGAVVVVDDLSHNDMRAFWEPLPYDRVEFAEFGWDAGMFRYDKSKEV